MNNITMKMNADELILQALREDITSEDITTNSVMPHYQAGEVELICKQDGVIAGLEVFKKVFELLDELGLSPKSSTRRDKYILYLRDSEHIENFLTLIGALNATFTVMNSKIFKEFVNNANRATNCDNANINKSLKANEKYIEAISYLIDTDKIQSLPESLKETAFKRLEFRELNFEQLGRKFNPPISKSGIYHRLEKILEIYKTFSNEN